MKAIKRQIVPVDAFGNRKPRLRGWLHVVLCGIDYSNIFLIIAGAVCFALRKPNPVPGWFEFHEVFHLGTVIGYACHVVAIYLIVCALEVRSPSTEAGLHMLRERSLNGQP